MLDAPRLRDVLSYNPCTGIFTWRDDMRRVRAGATAGHVKRHTGYRTIGVDGKQYLAHRLAWLYVHGCWPIFEIDHINGYRDDNRLSNLRAATPSQNRANNTAFKAGLSGHKGIRAKDGYWQARIQIRGRRINLGQFRSIDDARAAYAEKAREAFGEFARLA